MLYYHPRVDLKTGLILGVEALVRFKHPELGVLSPAQFIPVAEENNLMMLINEWVLNEACAQNRRWQEKGFSPMSISVNVSTQQFQQPDIGTSIMRILAQTELGPGCLEIEIPESMIMEDPRFSETVMRGLRGLGIGIVIDDYSGKCDLECLGRLPADMLKIDISLIRRIVDDPVSAASVEKLIATALHLKLKVVGEGVETLEQLDMLRMLDCDGIQGYTDKPSDACRRIHGIPCGGG